MSPVFVYEWITTARRWQMYAVRALFLAVLLAAVTIVWAKNVESHTRFGPDRKEYERIGTAIFYAFVGTQLAIILLAAPAATAGSVCLDKARGNLLHLLVTDLTPREIVVGKLFARLIPVLGLVLSSIPVLMACSWFGGLDLEALLGAYAVTVGVAVFGCALALLLSIWGRKTHEVLLATYLIQVLLLMAYPAVSYFEGVYWKRVVISDQLFWTNPFLLVFAPYDRPGLIQPWHFAAFLAICVVLAAGFTVLGVATVRRVTVHQSSMPQTKPRRGTLRRQRWPWTPTLDGNPVLWREWHRQRPSRWVRVVWAVYALVAVAATATLWLAALMTASRPEEGMAAFTSGLQVSIGLLLVSVSAVTALAEERVRGSLDMLLATPLPTRKIVSGKWRGSFRGVPCLAILPMINVVILASYTGRWLSVWYMLALVLTYGAAVTSLGLALATWIRKLGRAVAASAACYAFVAAGWLALVSLIFLRGGHETFEALASASPFYGPGELAFETGHSPGQPMRCYTYLPIWMAIYAGVAAALYLLTLSSFDRCLGRMANHLPGIGTPHPRRGNRSPKLPSAVSARHPKDLDLPLLVEHPAKHK